VVTVKLHTSRWRCLNEQCERQTFSERLFDIAKPYARQTERVAELIRLFGHGVGGQPAERLMTRLGLPRSGNTILRHLKRSVADRIKGKVRVLGIDDWSWLKSVNYGTIMVDLERREVVDVLPDRSATATAVWLGQHAEVEVVSSDRCGLYAQSARKGAPQARQVADRFHLLQNLRETIEKQLSRVDRGMARPALPIDEEKHNGSLSYTTQGQQEMAEHRRLMKQAHHRSRQEIFDRVQILKNARATVRDIARDLGVGWRTARKWVFATAASVRRERTPTLTSAKYFRDYLLSRWSDGCTRGRLLFEEIKARGYLGSYSNMQRALVQWGLTKRPTPSSSSVLAQEPAKMERTTSAGVLAEAPATPRAVDPATGWLISPIVAAALCMKPRGQLTPDQAAKVAALKGASPDFVVMRGLAMRFRGILRSRNVTRLEAWLNDGQRSGLFAIQRFVRTLRRDIDAVRNGVTETWSNGQTEGQINRLKTLKRAMYGRAGVELLRARMLPLSSIIEHGK
jgi:transposase